LGAVLLTERDFPPGLKVKQAGAEQEVKHRAKNVSQPKTVEAGELEHDHGQSDWKT
jgi:hypothetical protein